MRRITDVQLPMPLGQASDQRHTISLDSAGHIESVRPMAAGDAMEQGAESWKGDWISPRGIDLQINGGLGLAFPELTPADLPRLQQLQERL